MLPIIADVVYTPYLKGIYNHPVGGIIAAVVYTLYLKGIYNDAEANEKGIYN